MAFLNIMFELFVTNFCICESFEIENSIFTRKLSVWPNWCIGWRLEPSTLESILPQVLAQFSNRMIAKENTDQTNSLPNLTNFFDSQLNVWMLHVNISF